MKPCAVFSGHLYGSVGTQEACFGVAYLRVQGGGLFLRALVFKLEVLEVGLHHILVLAVCHNQFASLTEKTVELCAIVDEHVARR